MTGVRVLELDLDEVWAAIRILSIAAVGLDLGTYETPTSRHLRAVREARRREQVGLKRYVRQLERDWRRHDAQVRELTRMAYESFVAKRGE